MDASRAIIVLGSFRIERQSQPVQALVPLEPGQKRGSRDAYKCVMTIAIRAAILI